MPSGSDKWIRSLKDNPAGKVVADTEGNRWEWQSDEETAYLLKKLNNDELSIEKTDIRPSLNESADKATRATKPSAARTAGKPLRPSAPDKGGGFNPYDNSGKAKRR
jgi:hypothetical protein